MKFIRAIKLFNFKRFRAFSIELDSTMNIIIGDNEAGKSTLLQAIDITLSGSRNKVESYGLDKLLNIDVVNEFMQSERSVSSLPKLVVELYFSEMNNPSCSGENNTEKRECDGICLICEPSSDYSAEIRDILNGQESCFPYEYYVIRFFTFSGEIYSGYRKFLRHIFLDNAMVNGTYATREYIKTVYEKSVSEAERIRHNNDYRQSKFGFKTNTLAELNLRLSNYEFDIRTDTKSNLINDLTISEGSINIENKGKGRQCLVKTEFALQRSTSSNDIDVLLIEEPENHLSHINMKLLISRIADNTGKQIFITTHSSLISSQLDLRKTVLINSTSDMSIKLTSLPIQTAEYFMKTPNHNILEFILSNKVILVEGAAEYILLDAFFKKIQNQSVFESGVHIIPVGGTIFKPYLDISRLLNIKTAVIRDNDGDMQENCINAYLEYSNLNTKIFFETDNNMKTFEISLYEANRSICDEMFAKSRRTLTVQQYMLKNKTEVAFQLLDNRSTLLSVPKYIEEAIVWIKD